jgi:hypothetical protein
MKRAILITSAMFALAACGRSSQTVTAVPDRAVSSAHLSALDAERGAPGPHGVETESGVPFMVNDGNSHIMFPGSSSVSQSNDGTIVVTTGRHTRVFSAHAIVARSGEYHHYAAVAH